MAEHDSPTDYRRHFPLIAGKPDLAYWDNAATTQVPRPVIAATSHYYEQQHANIHRGQYPLAVTNTDHVEAVRTRLASFLHAPAHYQIIFNSGATAGLNQLAYGIRPLLKPGTSLIAIGDAHHANLVPWQQAARATGASLIVVPVDTEGTIDSRAWDAALKEHPVLVALTHVSNVTGRIHPVAALAAEARAAGAYVVADGAQAAGHLAIDLTKLEVDAYVFSTHKFYGPTGLGILAASQPFLDKLDPYPFGGGMIAAVHDTSATWAELPARFEGGTLNLAGINGFAATLDWLETISWPLPLKDEAKIVAATLAALQDVPGVTLYGPTDPEKRVGVFAFSVEGLHPHDIAEVMGREGVAVRAGHHCAMPLHTSLNIPASVRASAALYTTEEDITKLTDALRAAIAYLSHGR